MDFHVFPFQLEVGIRSLECRQVRLFDVPFTRWKSKTHVSVVVVSTESGRKKA